MKSVLISIQPKWCELIANGEKTIEVRKTVPKEVPFKCYIYCTNAKQSSEVLLKSKSNRFEFGDYRNADSNDWSIASGNVIGEFVCDKVEDFSQWEYDYGALLRHIDLYTKASCNYHFLHEYLKGKKQGYGWLISDVNIYDKPKALNEFISPTKAKNCVDYCLNGICSNLGYEELCGAIRRCEYKKLSRPPQSWCYVEESK